MSATTNGDANTFSGPLVKVLFLIGSVSMKPKRERGSGEKCSVLRLRLETLLGTE